eukprot:s3573_g1.t1
MSAPRGDRGGERKRRQHFYTCQDYCISEAKRLFGFTLPREDYRELDSHGHERHIEAIVETYNNYGSDWSSLCVQVPALAQVVPSSKGGQKGKGKGRQPNVANPAAKPKAAPVAKPTGAAEPKAAAKTETKDKRGTPAQAKAESFGDVRASASASSSGGPPVAAPVAEGAAPPVEPKTAPEKPVEDQPPAAVASEQPTLESVAPDAQPTATDVLPKEEPELDDLVVKEEPAEEAQAEAPEEEAEAEGEEGPVPIEVDEEAVVHITGCRGDRRPSNALKAVATKITSLVREESAPTCSTLLSILCNACTPCKDIVTFAQMLLLWLVLGGHCQHCNFRLAQVMGHDVEEEPAKESTAKAEEPAKAKADEEPAKTKEEAPARDTKTKTKEISSDAAMPFAELEPFGRETTGQDLTEASIRESDAMIDQIEKAEIAEEERSVFRALTRLRGAALASFDGIARAHEHNIQEYAQENQYRKVHPVKHLAEEEALL